MGEAPHVKHHLASEPESQQSALDPKGEDPALRPWAYSERHGAVSKLQTRSKGLSSTTALKVTS